MNNISKLLSSVRLQQHMGSLVFLNSPSYFFRVNKEHPVGSSPSTKRCIS